MATLPLTRSKHLLPFAAVLRRQGEAVERLVRAAGLPSTCLDDSETLVPIVASTRFRDLCARKTGLPNIALAATEPLHVEDLGDFGQTLVSAPTLQRSLFELRRLTGSQSSNLIIELQPQPNGDLACSHRVLSEVGVGEWHRALYSLSLMLKVVRLAAPAWSPAEIWLDTQAAPGRFEAIESLGSSASFEHQSTGFVVPASMLALPVAKGAVPSARDDQELLSMSPAKTYAVALQQMLRSYVPDGWLSIDRVSEAAGTSVRTMQRRLSTEQTTYSRVVEETRATMAGELLETTDATIGEIARELGYRNQGDFTRAFRRWAGVSPSDFRRQRSR